jgi:hypothetical protein
MVTLPVDPIIVDQSSADPTRTDKKQEIDEDHDCQVHKVYHFYNCVVHLDSQNTHTTTMENCGNHLPQVTCSSFFFFSFIFVLM